MKNEYGGIDGDRGKFGKVQRLSGNDGEAFFYDQACKYDQHRHEDRPQKSHDGLFIAYLDVAHDKHPKQVSVLDHLSKHGMLIFLRQFRKE